MTSGTSIAWLNGEWMPLIEAKISPLDRGFLFGDAVYEVVPVTDGIPMLLAAHLHRLEESLASARIKNPYSENKWQELVGGLIKRNGGGTMAVYLQVSRGADQTRAREIPDGLVPTVFGLVLTVADAGAAKQGCAAVLLNDDRWLHCDIKSTSMLANILLGLQASDAGAAEAILVRDGYLTEGTSSSIIVVENNVLLTRPDGPELLPGTTVRRVLDIATNAGIRWREEKVNEARLRAADEIWLMSATRDIVPVTRLDGKPVGTGQPGPLWQRVDSHFSAWKDEQIAAAQTDAGS